MRIAILGGTAGLGKGLAARLAVAGHEVSIGSRSGERARSVVEELNSMIDRPIKGGLNEESVTDAEVIIVAVPFTGIYEVIKAVRDRIQSGAVVVSAVVPLASELGGNMAYVELPEGSAAEAIARLLGNRAHVVSAFTNLPANPLLRLDRPLEYDVVVCGEREPVGVVSRVVESIERLRALYGGPLRYSRVTERLTELLIWFNVNYKSDDAGVRFVGV
ncbi:MAG: NADPH-dependent F420 reductase [Aigarchaeota archaeon]|nr:NADPH-dependent F420 reductase [Aigarchaeota archaeon]MDW8092329.1 NADPH-dependent F420 reductase [Nitrososphaerota archaeon]